jgi:hypothetical protein
MAYPTPVNSRITDAVAQSSVGVLGNASAMAMGSVYQSSAHSISIAFENAVQAQRQAAICAQAATNQGVIQVYSAGTAAAAAATARVAHTSSGGQSALVLLVALRAMKLI